MLIEQSMKRSTCMMVGRQHVILRRQEIDGFVSGKCYVVGE